MRTKRVRTFIVLCGLIALLLTAVAGCAPAGDASGQIELSATDSDLGTVPNDQPVSEVFQVRNAGLGALEIRGVSTSCGCTTAQVGKSRLEAGEATDLTVTYDPQVHNGETGTFLRIVYVRSSDPDTPEASLAIRVTVVDMEAAG